MPSKFVAVLVVALLLPGLALVVAVVIRLAIRGIPRPDQHPHRDDDDSHTGT